MTDNKGKGDYMEYRQFGKTDMKISELSFGTWAIGGAWGKNK